MFKSGIFPIKAAKGEESPSGLARQLKILTPKQMLQILPIALAQIKTGSIYENLINEIMQIIC